MRPSFLLAWALALLLNAGEARAHPWMIRHGYASCGSCHADPSGAGLLTEYGRAQSALLLTFNPRPAPEGEEEEVSESAGFLFGWVRTPEWLLLGANLRGGGLFISRGETQALRPLLMATDLRAQVRIGEHLRAHASVGFSVRGAAAAAITPSAENTLVSREHWLGADLAEGAVTIRAGRMTLPFGLRNIEHTSFVRTVTRTDLNTGQQHGISVAYNAEGIRAEAMAIAGNFQVSPDIYRERGYSAYAEFLLAERLAVGASSLITRADRDTLLRRTNVRHAHGLFARYAPSEQLVLMAEADFLLQWPSAVPTNRLFQPFLGYVSLAQADYELLRGLHVLGTLEVVDEGRRSVQGRIGPSFGAWLSLVFFPLPQTELRLDAIYQRIPTGDSVRDSLSLLAQAHVFL